MKIGIDAGHGVKFDRGGECYLKEEDIINSVVAELIPQLKEKGHTIIELRPLNATSTQNSLSQRSYKANSEGVDLVLSIHANAAAEKNTAYGSEVFTYKARKAAWAVKILENLEDLGFYNRNIKDGSKLHIVRNTNAACYLIEVCFFDSKSDVELYKKVGEKKIAQAISDALPTELKRCYIKTKYLSPEHEGYDGIAITEILKKYDFPGKVYLRKNEKGVWLETDWITSTQAENLKNRLGNLFFSIEN